MLRSAVLLLAAGEATRLISKSHHWQPTDECEETHEVGISSTSAWSGEPNTPQWCGGVLISDKWVLTTSSCFFGNEQFTVFAGEWSINTSEIAHHWDHKVLVMMLKLESAVPPSSCSKAVQLPSADLADGTNCWATGWADGFDETLDLTLHRPTTIRYQVEVTGNPPCNDKLSWLINVDTICSAGSANGDNVEDICPQSEGFPLVCEENGSSVLHGVGFKRFGASCTGEPQGKYPEVFSRVGSGLIEWIRATALHCPDACSTDRCQADWCQNCDFC